MNGRGAAGYPLFCVFVDFGEAVTRFCNIFIQFRLQFIHLVHEIFVSTHTGIYWSMIYLASTV